MFILYEWCDSVDVGAVDAMWCRCSRCDVDAVWCYVDAVWCYVRVTVFKWLKSESKW